MNCLTVSICCLQVSGGLGSLLFSQLSRSNSLHIFWYSSSTSTLCTFFWKRRVSSAESILFFSSRFCTRMEVNSARPNEPMTTSASRGKPCLMNLLRCIPMFVIRGLINISLRSMCSALGGGATPWQPSNNVLEKIKSDERFGTRGT